MSAPWLSVLMPTYNGAAYLRSALGSVLRQADKEIECIAVDDGSTDETLAILDSYRTRLNLTVIERPRVGNWVANTNLALERASGRFACFLHQDDWWLDGRLEALRALIHRHRDVELFLHPVRFIDRRGRDLGPWRCPLPPEPRVLRPGDILPRLIVQNFIAIPAPVFSAAKARALGGLDEALWYTADWDLWLKLAAKGRTVYHPEPLCCFRIHDQAQTATRSHDGEGFRAQQQIVLDRYLQDLASVSSEVRATAAVARFSIEVNAALAAKYHGQRMNPVPLLSAFTGLGPLGWYRYGRYSRIWERLRSRLKARGNEGVTPVGALSDANP